MEQKDLDLILANIDNDEELKKLWREHLELEKKLDEFSSMKYLSTEDELRRKQMQKLKLAGKDKLEQMLAKYRD